MKDKEWGRQANLTDLDICELEGSGGDSESAVNGRYTTRNQKKSHIREIESDCGFNHLKVYTFENM